MHNHQLFFFLILLLFPWWSRGQEECFDPLGDCTLATPIEFELTLPVRCGDTVRLDGTDELCNSWTIPVGLNAWPGTGVDSTAYFVRIENCAADPIRVDGVTLTPSGSGEASCDTSIDYLFEPILDTVQQALSCTELLALPSSIALLSSSCGCDSVLVEYFTPDFSACVDCNQQCIFVGGQISGTTSSATLSLQFLRDGVAEDLSIADWSGATIQAACFPIQEAITNITITATLPTGDTGTASAETWLADNPGQVDSTFLTATTCIPAEAGTVVDTLLASTGCDSLIITNTLLLPPPEIEIPTPVGCVGDVIELVAFAGAEGEFLWSTGATTQSIEVLDDAIYTVTFTDTEGCQVIGTAQAFYSQVDTEITWSVDDPLVISEAPLTVWEGAAVQYEAVVTQALPPFEFVWNGGPELGDTVLNAVARESQEVTVAVIDSFGCFNTATLPLTVIPVNTFVPTAFSPNGDNINDRLDVFTSKNVERVRLQVFARPGNLVYDEFLLIDFPEDIGLRWSGWDGNFLGKPMLPQTFAYLLSYRALRGEWRYAAGEFTLVK